MRLVKNVRKLTQGVRSRRNPVARCGFRACLAILVITSLPVGLHAATSWHPTADMAAVAEAFVATRVDPSAVDTAVRAGQLDSRLNLASCEVALQAFLRPGTVIGPKTLVGVRCSGAKPWKIYVPVEVTVHRPVWIARQALPRGHVLTADDLSSDVRDISRMTTSYVSSRDSLLGQKLKTSILAGRILTLQLIEADSIVLRGQTVTLAVSTGGLDIRVTGKALSDGALNQRIRVENLTSGRIIEGIVRSRELVEVLVAGAAGTRSRAN